MKIYDDFDDAAPEVAESFSRYARGYDKHARLQKMMAERLASFLPDELPPRTLEIGCGTGLFTRHLLARPIHKLILNDIAPEMIQCLKDKQTIPRRCRVLLGNAESLDFGPVDLIAANAVFQWFKTPKKALEHLAALLEPGGRIIFSTFGPATLEEFRRTADLSSPANLLSFERWKRLIRGTGLTLDSSASELRKSFFPDALALLKNLQQIGAAPYRMVRPGSLRQLIRRYDEEFSTAQGVYATWELYYFSAIHKPSRKKTR
ncbi:hypothetical protein UR09_05240 [Candidatus Nitromaritima sp. SCGC AAA799-A02]|nr:hypothetical protein UR09_05240 [Candidatus Nitromaritima sp. SCGC AAA799-A02]